MKLLLSQRTPYMAWPHLRQARRALRGYMTLRGAQRDFHSLFVLGMLAMLRALGNAQRCHRGYWMSCYRGLSHLSCAAGLMPRFVRS